MNDIYLKIQEQIHSSKKFVVLTLADKSGSAPQEIGAKAMVGPEGLIYGTVGGGKLEARCIEVAQSMIETQERTKYATWNLQKDIGMSCGGTVSIFFEQPLANSWKIVIFGAGHISQELCRVLATHSCEVLVADFRQEWLDRLPKSSNIKIFLQKDPSEIPFIIPAGSQVLVMTQGHSTDLPILKKVLLLPTEQRFLGVIGSELKGRKIKAELQDWEKEFHPEIKMGPQKEFQNSSTQKDSNSVIAEQDNASESKSDIEIRIERIKCPLGTMKCKNTPPEIAISILCELIQNRDSK